MISLSLIKYTLFVCFFRLLVIIMSLELGLFLIGNK